MTVSQIHAARYVLDRSWTCRRWRAHSCRLAGEAVTFLERHRAAPEDADRWRPRLAAHLADCVRRDRVGNPVVIWVLLNLVVPIVVRLVVEWWLRRKEG